MCIRDRGIDSVVIYCAGHFNTLSVEAMIRLIALVLIALVIVGLMKIPFSLLEARIVSLLRAILPGFLAAALNFFVRLAINLIYLCLVVLLMASFISQGLENKPVTLRDLFEKPLRFNFGRRHDDACSPQIGVPQTVNSNLAKTENEAAQQRKEEEAFAQAETAAKTEEQIAAEIDEAFSQEFDEPRILEDPIDPLIQPRGRYPYYNNEEKTAEKQGWGIGKIAARLMIGICLLCTSRCV